MTNIVDLAARRVDAPDPEFVCRDFRTTRVDTMYAFAATYAFDGEEWSIEIWARDLEEARRKLAAVSSGRIDGQIFSQVDA